jgi:PrtD family type I secretion system ABC transporter
LSLRRICSRPALLSLFGFSVVANLLMLTGPLFMLQIYDRVLASGSVPTLVGLTVLAIFALAAMAGIEAARGSLLQRVAVRFEEEHNPEVFTSAVSARLAGRRNAHQLLLDVETIRSFLNGPGVLAMLDAPWAPLFLLLIFAFHPVLGLVAAGGAACLFVLAGLNEALASGTQRRGSAALAETHGLGESALHCAQASAAMGMVAALRHRWAAAKVEGLALLVRAGERSGLVQAASRGLRQALQIAMLAVGAALVIDKDITAGVMIVASIIMGRALAPVEQSIGHWRSFEAARVAWRRLADLLAAMPDRRTALPLPAISGAIALDRVVCVPPGARAPVLKSVSFAVDAGTALAIVGPSGAGKSTLVRVLTGIWPPVSGTVRIDGATPQDYGEDGLGRHIGYVPQEIELLDGTVAENIARFAIGPDEDEIIRAARQAGAHDLILGLPEGYDTRITDFGRTLSGGERQRIALARALYGRPAIVILDEPSAHMDRAGEEALLHALREVKNAGATTIMVAHRPSLLQHVDQVLVLDDGRVLAFGSRDDVIAKLTPPKLAHPLPGHAAEPRSLAG